jgi:hypothetical protein
MRPLCIPPSAPTVVGVWSRYSFPVIFFGLWYLAIASGSLAVIAGAVALTAGYGISLIIHPRARHRACGGTGELRGRIFTWSHRRCPDCQGGRIIRAGASVAGLPHVRQQARAQQRAQQSTTARQRW